MRPGDVLGRRAGGAPELAGELRLAREGYRVQSLIAYGEFWYPWYMRRLAERPANVLVALRQLVP